MCHFCAGHILHHPYFTRSSRSYTVIHQVINQDIIVKNIDHAVSVISDTQ